MVVTAFVMVAVVIVVGMFVKCTMSCEGGEEGSGGGDAGGGGGDGGGVTGGGGSGQ